MFERRLKILLSVLLLAGLLLFGRAFTLQVLGRATWAKAELRLATRPPELTATTRGRILDVHGTPLAVDTACTDASVDYRAIVDPPEPKWVEDTARARLKARYGADFSPRSRAFTLDDRKRMLGAEKAAVVADVADMWVTLAQLYRPTDPEAAVAVSADPRAALDDVRRSIVRQVEMRRRLMWTVAYRRGEARSAQSGRLLRWLGLGGGGGAGNAGVDGPDIDAYAMTTGEQQASHVVLHALDADACNFLATHLDRFPGLTLQPSTHRFYPLHDVACHLLGQTAGPTPEQLKRSEGDDLTRRYEPAEQDVGREGVEALCEPLLRGTRGRVDRRAADGAVVDRQDFVPGQDVRLTIDADLQAKVQHLLQHVVETVQNDDGRPELITPPDGVSMHAAAVVIDVKTNEVRALASNPVFDVNDLETRFAALNGDVVNGPLTDRATSDAIEPGSTVKPMVGLGAITDGAVGPLEGIECKGYVLLPVIAPDGTRTTRLMPLEGAARCWVKSELGAKLKKMGMSAEHHPVPFNDPHRGHDRNQDGWLTMSDALERSCDVYFETVADRMGREPLCGWYDRFGLGRPTGIGIHEARGLLESQFVGFSRVDPRVTNCLAGMGQGYTGATPLQIANVMATIARGGVWMRPRLLAADTQAALDAARPRPATAPSTDLGDLHLNPAGLEQARIGMRAAFEKKGGTGYMGPGHTPRWDPPEWLTVACKTGTADTHPFTYLLKPSGGPVVRQSLQPVVRGHPETDTPWYRSEFGTNFVHAWYVGYAPVDDPQVAFAVVVEYAGAGGGTAAGPVAAGLLDACMADGYLHPPGTPTTQATTEPTTTTP